MAVFQTRTNYGKIENFDSFNTAYAHYLKNKNIQKIAWDDNNRWQCKRKCNLWLPESEARLCTLSAEYANEPRNSERVFWIRQLMVSPVEKQPVNKQLTNNHEITICLGRIETVLTEEQFYEMYKNI